MNEIITVRQNRHSGAGRNPVTFTHIKKTNCFWIPACAGMTALYFFVFMFLYAAFIRLSIRANTLRQIMIFFVGQLWNKITHKLRPDPLLTQMELTPTILIVRK